MSIQTGSSSLLAVISALSDGNWFVWKKGMRKFLLANSAGGVLDGVAPKDGLDDDDTDEDAATDKNNAQARGDNTDEDAATDKNNAQAGGDNTDEDDAATDKNRAARSGPASARRQRYSPIIDDRMVVESSPSGSDYEADAAKRDRIEARKRRRGEDSRRTDDEDAEDEREFEADAEAEDSMKGKGRPSGSKGGKRTSRKAPIPAVAGATSLGPTSTGPASGDEGNDDLMDVDGDDEDWEKTSGPFSKAAKDACIELGRQFNAQAKAIARQFGKRKAEVVKHAGVTLQATRGTNPSCKYTMYHAHHYPKPPGGGKEAHRAYMREVRAAYDAIVDGKTEEERTEALKPIMEWCEEYEKGALGNSAKSASTLMQEAGDQFDNLSRIYDTHGVVVMGVIVSTSEDDDASKMSRIFGTDPAMLDFVDANEFNVRVFLKWITNCIVCHKYSTLGVNLPLLPGMKTDADVKGKGKATKSNEGREGRTRDSLRKEATDKMLADIQDFLPDITAMPWANWLNIAWLHKLCIENWPAGLSTPGSGFRFKRLTLPDLLKIVEGYEVDGERYHVKIVRWNAEDLELDDASAEISTVGLVLDVNGNKLKCVRDSKAYLRIHLMLYR
ncbi:hypothetical protein PLICRDRAFT_180851 [Plicaturopsis crispa FD-325 SS-3]|uniref:Uncharacterized protein n=1 Tax=Plicaturopsis crispa FD-325 SS-3 TaxID=944288 RepID=A0A0C9SVD0_PLICR|nr:hypothetical protein PLICRDRAFT_180851 [Plicaturopsis crispa FD-325 SS-3]